MGGHDKRMMGTYNSSPEGYQLIIDRPDEGRGVWDGWITLPNKRTAPVSGYFTFEKDKNGTNYTFLKIRENDSYSESWHLRCYSESSDGTVYYEKWNGHRAGPDNAEPHTSYSFYKDLSENGSNETAIGWNSIKRT